MRDVHCEICGTEEPSTLSEFPIVPDDVSSQTGLKSKKVNLCDDCRLELNRWFLSKIAQTSYDPMAKQFRPKSAERLASEYETAYNWFVRSKKAVDATAGG